METIPKTIQNFLTSLFNKNLLIVVAALLFLISCKQEPQKASIEGTFTNLPDNVTKVVLRTKAGAQNIELTNGHFKDTINVDNDFAYLQIGTLGKSLFLDQNTHLIIKADLNDFEKSLRYSGNGKQANTYLNEREQITQNIFVAIDSINNLNKPSFDNYILKIKSDIEALLEKNTKIPTKLITSEKENLKLFIENLNNQYNAVNGLSGKLKEGDKAPDFSYENYQGGTTSLNDLRGNFVYIDLWATWCPPCKTEIPFLKKLEEKYPNKNIKFVSISLDNPNSKNNWKKMINNKQMGGIQLFANGDSSLTKAYDVKGIPRFILLDTKGNIITTNAPRPSSGAMEKKFDLLTSN